MKHQCHWAECEVEVPPKMWGCKPHWQRLPRLIRKAITDTYRPGQEVDKMPTGEYLENARAAHLFAVMQNQADAGNIKVVVIEEQPPQQCDDCGEIAELRPYGARGQPICFDCAMKDPETTNQMFHKVHFGEEA